MKQIFALVAFVAIMSYNLDAGIDFGGVVASLLWATTVSYLIWHAGGAE